VRRLFCILMLLASPWAWAEMDLKEAFERALQVDPALQASRQELLGLEEVVPQARAALLPNVSASASRNRVWLDREELGVSSASKYFSQNNTLVVRQPLWRRPQWVQLEQARTQAGTAEFVRRRAQADLLVRLSAAYFDLLYAERTLEFVAAVATASVQQLRSARRVFELGQGTRTDIDEAQARYDQAQAQSVQARQNRDYARRQMALLVGQEVLSLKSARVESAVPPQITGSLDDWLALARSGNADLQLARARLALAELEVRRAQAGHDPTLDLIGQRSLSKSENTQFPNSSYDTTQIGLQLNLPIFAGGAVSSAVRQAVANREREAFVVEQVSNDLTLKIQREVHSLQEGEDRLRAARQALLSAAQLVVSTTKGVQAGTRTVLDTLNAAQREAEVRRELALVHYQLQLSRLRLAALCGEDLLASAEQLSRQLQAAP
jgi:protease secretion system outer membrane protein